MMEGITIISVVENDPGLVDLMIKSVLRFTKPTVRFIFCDNSNGKNEARIKKALGSYKNYKIIKNQPTMGGGSNRHGEGLNKIFKNCNIDTEYMAIIESDVVVLTNDWYKVKPGFNSKGAKKTENSEHTYHACFFIFKSELLKKMDWRAGKNGCRFNNKSYSTQFDVGWNIRDFIRQDYVEVIKFVDCKTGQGKILDSSFQSDEFWKDGVPIAVHFGRGSNIKGKANRKNFPSHDEQLSKFKTIVGKEIV